MGNKKLGLIDAWLLPLRSLRSQHYDALAGLSPEERTQKLVEENVLAGVRTLKQNSSVIEAIKERGLKVHGLVYDISCGQLKELETSEDEGVEKSRFDAFFTS